MNQEVEKQIESAIQDLYANNQYKLKNICNKMMAKFGGLSQKDYDEFYSRAGKEIAVAKFNKRYNPLKEKTALDFLSGVIRRAVLKEIKDRNRIKRQVIIETEEDDEYGNTIKRKEYVPAISIDTPIGDDSGMTIGDILQSDFSMDDILLNMDKCQDERIERYLGSLPKTTREVIEMKMRDISVKEIKNRLGLSDNEYNTHINNARMNENIGLFTKRSNRHKEEKKVNNIMPIDVTDNYRMDKFPLGSLLDDMRDGKINKRHILQRKAFQWTERQKNKYLTRVLNGQPIPEIVICEQNIKGKKKSHLIDGLQRLSYAELFRADGIVVKLDGAEFYEIPYKQYKYDSKNNIMLDEDGDALFEEKIFNVIGKKFSEFPQFLKERFNKFNINVITYFDCTDDQIAYHIRNYNNQEGMNKNQYEFTGLDVNIAEKVKLISDKHPFFKDNYGKYIEKNKIKGDIDKVVIESIMAINFPNDWKKEVKDSFEFVNKNVTDCMFDTLKNSLDRLSKVIDKEVKNMFTTVNSPVWFAVFEKFKELNVEDVKFKNFVKYIGDNLDNLKISDKLFAEIYKSKSTRDKSIVIGKINGLVTLMYEFLHIDEMDNTNKSIETFIAQNLNMNIDTIYENMDFYEKCLTDLTDKTIRDGSKLLNKENHDSLLAMFIYSFENNVEIQEWLTEYAEKNNTYYIDQKENFLHMKQDFKQYCKEHKISA